MILFSSCYYVFATAVGFDRNFLPTKLRSFSLLNLFVIVVIFIDEHSVTDNLYSVHCTVYSVQCTSCTVYTFCTGISTIINYIFYINDVYR